jgi:phage-related protein (TIGR01555 family)
MGEDQMSIRDRLRAALGAIVADPHPEKPVADTTPVAMPPFWSNAYTGLGTTERDRTAWHSPGGLDPIDDETFAALWQADPIAKTVIEAIVDDGMRCGFQVAYHGEEESDRELVSQVADLAAEVDLECKARLAAKSARAFRGGGFLVEANGGGSSFASKPFDPERVTSVDHLVVWDSRDLTVVSWSMDEHQTYIYSPSYQTTSAESWGVQFDASHAVVFPGMDTTIRDRHMYWNGWYRPALQHVVEAIRDFRQSWQSTIGMLQDGSQGLLYLPDLARTLATIGRSVLETRLNLIQLYRSALRLMPLDAGGGAVPSEKFEWAERSFAGIAELLHESQDIVAQAAEIPKTRLFGNFASSGLNNAGEGSERDWYARVDAWRRAKIQPPVEYVVRLLARCAGAEDPQRWGIDWPGLEVMSSQEKAALLKLEADTDAVWIQNGVPEEVILKHRFGGGTYTHDPPLLTEDDLGDIEATAESEREAAEEAMQPDETPGQLKPFTGEEEDEPEPDVEPEEEA